MDMLLLAIILYKGDSRSSIGGGVLAAYMVSTSAGRSLGMVVNLKSVIGVQSLLFSDEKYEQYVAPF